jgi:hypothetical protein
VTRRGDVAISVGGEASPERRKGGDDASWVDVNFTVPKNKKIHTVDSAATIER